MFDLNGYLIHEDVVAPGHLVALNAAFDGFPDLEFKEWWGDVQRLDNKARAGMELQNIVHAEKSFEDLTDHPGWVTRMHRYCGEEQTWIPGLFIDECFASVRQSVGFFPMDSGGQ